ncbi:hypothetical protein L7F22_027312 [Adiantum nelumboides]|nr:hypothetical protein [Adiantum nelumboides]
MEREQQYPNEEKNLDPRRRDTEAALSNAFARSLRRREVEKAQRRAQRSGRGRRHEEDFIDTSWRSRRFGSTRKQHSYHRERVTESDLTLALVIANDGKPKYKARLVAKGFKKQQGIDFDEIFFFVVKMTTLRCVLALVAKEDMEIVQMVVKTTFLHGDPHEDIYLQQPERFVVKGKEHLVCKLKKILYGLKRVPREWYHKFHLFMLSQGYRQSDIDHCLYRKQAKDGSFLILILHVDDMLLAKTNIDKLVALQSKLNYNFDMKDLGDANHILGM